MKRHTAWLIKFSIFCKSVYCAPVDTSVFALVQMNEKWFCTAIVRSNKKLLTLIGLELSECCAYHNNYVGKIMRILAESYSLADDDIPGRGKVVPISCIRVGKMVKATKDSRKRVCKEDGSLHYLKYSTKLLLKKVICSSKVLS